VLNLAEAAFAGPPLLVCGIVVVVTIYAMLRRAAGSELMAFVALGLFACIDFDTRTWDEIHPPSYTALLALAGWQLGYGIWSRTTLRLAVGGAIMLLLLSRIISAPGFYANYAYLSFAILWFSILPLIATDALARWLRTAGPVLMAFAATWMTSISPSIWPSPVIWALAASETALVALSLIYWARFGLRWYVLASAWSAAMAGLLWSASVLGLLHDAQLKHGLFWYVAGCQLLIAALLMSLWKGGVVRTIWSWLQDSPSSSYERS
jgi:hypothetical protein